MRHFSTLIFIFFIVSSLLGCSHGEKERFTAQAQSVDVAYPVIDSVVLYRSYPGFLSAKSEVDIIARVNGYLTSTGYANGRFVHKGQILFTIEDSQYRDAVNQAQAQLETAHSNNVYATNQYEAMKKALASDAVSQMDVIQAESNMNESRASIKSAEAALQTALTNLSYCTVRAPFSGHISAAIVDVGTYLNGEAAPVTLAKLYDDKTVNANFAIEDNSYLKMLSSGNNRKNIDYTRIPIKFNKPLTHSYTGNLDYMSPGIDTGTGTLRLRASIDNPHGELRSGMFVTVEMPYNAIPEAVLVKDASIASDQSGQYLYTVNDSDIVVYTPIETGELFHDTLRIVTKGITTQSRYVTKAMLKVRDGMKVKPVTVN